MMSDIFKAGFSRIPVYGDNKNDVIGLVLTKDLIFVDPSVSIIAFCNINRYICGIYVCF